MGEIVLESQAYAQIDMYKRRDVSVSIRGTGKNTLEAEKWEGGGVMEVAPCEIQTHQEKGWDCDEG